MSSIESRSGGSPYSAKFGDGGCRPQILSSQFGSGNDKQLSCYLLFNIFITNLDLKIMQFIYRILQEIDALQAVLKIDQFAGGSLVVLERGVLC